MISLDIIFVIFVFLSLYSYIIYPALLFVLARVSRKNWDRTPYSPGISLIISVYNEEQVIAEKVRNALELDYPSDRLEIIVVSDGSTDKTNEIVAQTINPRITLKSFKERSGKTACLNRVIPETKGEIAVFTDANSMFPSDLLKKMVRNFSDPKIGLVTGWTKYRDPMGEEATSGIYARFEKITKELESRISSCVGADGAVLGMRKSLYKPLREDDINDFVLPLQVVGQGKRVVLDPEVYCLEEPSRKKGGEYKRQVRITTRTLRAIFHHAEFLNPIKFGAFAFFLFSHKVIRFLTPFFLVLCFLINIILLGSSWIYLATFGGQILFYGVGILGFWSVGQGRVIEAIKYFLMTSAAQLVSWFRLFSGKSDIMWTPQR